jgi:propanol-preferring alcohol dehydrogenase
LEDQPAPVPAAGEVVVQVKAAGLCHTELHFLSGLLDLGVHPITLGHEIVGRVDRIGAGVTEVREGDRVIVYYYVGCGRCRHCLVGNENLCDALRAQYGFVSDGGFAEAMKVVARNCIPLPDDLGDEMAAPIACSVTTAVHSMNLARVSQGDVVLVYGIGAVGLGIVQLARHAGAEVLAVGRTPAKLEKAKELGAAHVINATSEPVADRVREITSGHGADVVMELVATKASMEQSTKALAKRGRLVFIGYSEDAYTVHPIQLVITEANVMGSVGSSRDELRQAVELVSRGVVTTVVDRTLPLDDFEKGIDALSQGQPVGRVVLLP